MISGNLPKNLPKYARKQNPPPLPASQEVGDAKIRKFAPVLHLRFPLSKRKITGLNSTHLQLCSTATLNAYYNRLRIQDYPRALSYNVSLRASNLIRCSHPRRRRRRHHRKSPLLEMQRSVSAALTCLPQPDKLQTLIKAANVEDVEAIWTSLFAKVQPRLTELDPAIANSTTRP